MKQNPLVGDPVDVDPTPQEPGGLYAPKQQLPRSTAVRPPMSKRGDHPPRSWRNAHDPVAPGGHRLGRRVGLSAASPSPRNQSAQTPTSRRAVTSAVLRSGVDRAVNVRVTQVPELPRLDQTTTPRARHDPQRDRARPLPPQTPMIRPITARLATTARHSAASSRSGGDFSIGPGSWALSV